jgi:hypothetical protein
MIVSFAWTTEAYLEGLKDVTRRFWTDEYAAQFPPGSVHQAWDKSPRSRGKRIGYFRVVSIERESLRRLLDDRAYGQREIQREGGLWKTPQQFVDLMRDQGKGDNPYRVEFEKLEESDDNSGVR